MAKVQGGKSVYGAAVGILMLETRFPRIPGDMGNAATWDFPVLYRVVDGASPDRVVRRKAEGLLDAFVAAGREMVEDGADGITTNCGFLSLVQPELANATWFNTRLAAARATPSRGSRIGSRRFMTPPSRRCTTAWS